MSYLIFLCMLFLGIINPTTSKLQYTPNELNPGDVARIKKLSHCTDDELESIHKKCVPLIHQLIERVYEFEHGIHSSEYGMKECERAQIACFSHKLWKESAQCVCGICNHVWLYDDEMHERFVTYFDDKRCKGTMPQQTNQMQFCDFMNQTERNIVPDMCIQNDTKTEQNDTAADYYSNDANNILYTNHAIILWTALVAITMSLSLYFWIH